MKSKKLIALIMSATMVISAGAMFAACGNNDDKDDGKNPGGEVTNPPVDGGEENQFVADTNNYYAVGNGLGDLSKNNWNASSDVLPFTKDADVTDENVYTITLTMYAGDAFKILCDTTKGWSGEQVNYYSLAATEYFSTNNDNNIICNVGYDGVYTFTLKTYPLRTEGKFALTVVQDSTVEAYVPDYDMSVMINSRNIKMVDKSGVWTADFTVKATDLVNDEAGSEVTGDAAKYAVVYVHNAGKGGAGDSTKDFCDVTLDKVSVDIEGVTVNVNLLEAGFYNVTYKQEDGSVTIKKVTDKWHIVVGGKLEVDENLDLTYSGDTGLWTGRVTLSEGASITLKNIGDGATDADVTVATLGAGTWVMKYNPETQKVDYESRESFYLTGSIYGWGDGPKNGTALKLTETSEGIYEIDVDWTTQSSNVSIKVIKGNFLDGVVDNAWFGGDSANEDVDNDGNYVRAPGKYHITFNTAGNVITITEITD